MNTTFFNRFYNSSLPVPPQEVDILNNAKHYLFSERYPEEVQTVEAILKTPLCDAPFIEMLQNPTMKALTPNVIRQQGEFDRFSSSFNSLVISHNSAPHLIFKQGYNFNECEDVTQWKGLPPLDSTLAWLHPLKSAARWLFPSSSDERLIPTPVGELNPLRPAMMERIHQCITKNNLGYIRACEDYLYPLPNAQEGDPLEKRYFVISKKANIVDEKENMRRIVELGETQPAKLKVIVEQICTLAKQTCLIDIHLDNFRFDVEKEILWAIDAEPIGAFADCSHPETIKAYRALDPAICPIYGMRKLKAGITHDLFCYGYSKTTVSKIQQIFDSVIDKEIAAILRERKIFYAKRIISVLCPLIPLFLLAMDTLNYLFNKLGSHSGTQCLEKRITHPARPLGE